MLLCSFCSLTCCGLSDPTNLPGENRLRTNVKQLVELTAQFAGLYLQTCDWEIVKCIGVAFAVFATRAHALRLRNSEICPLFSAQDQRAKKEKRLARFR